MKVLLITANFFPDKTGISVTATDCAKFISSFGHEVSVICGMPYYPEWKIRDNYRSKLFVAERLDSMQLKRVWLYVPQKPSPLRRVLHELSFSLLAFLRAIPERFDLVLCISPPLSSGLSAALISALRGKRFWFYVQDIQPDAAVELGMLRNPNLVRLLYSIERFIYTKAERVLVLSDGMKQNLLRKGVLESKIAIVPVSIDVRELSSSDQNQQNFWLRYGLEKRFVVLYSGNLGMKQDPAILVECAKLLKDHEDIFFAIVGDGAMRREIEQRINTYGLDNIRHFPLCDRSELGLMLRSSNLLLAPQRKEVTDFVMPSKLLAYLASGKPVVASASTTSEIARILSESAVGVLVEPENPWALAQAILTLKANPKKASEFGRRGLQYVLSNHDHEIVRERFYRPLFHYFLANK